MMHATDQELLRRYTHERAQPAFAELVARHLDLVYSAARRQVRSPQLAEEVVQGVFVELARNAARLQEGCVLAAWLYTVTRRTAIDLVRRETRRRVREQTAVELAAMNADTSGWSEIEPVLDEAMESLGERDRCAILLRFFENKNLREVGTMLGVSDDAAQKRIRRALERLRDFLVRRGVTTTAMALGTQLSAHAAQAAPLGLSISVTAAIASSSASTGTAAALATVTTVAMTTVQKILVTAGLAAVIAGGLYQVAVIRQQRAHIRALEGAAKALEEERDTARRELAAAGREIRATDATLGEAEKLLADAAQALTAGETLARPELLAWIERTKGLKAWAARMPERTIPEMSLLTETDWLEAARTAELSTETGARKALADLRLIAKKHFRPKLEQALKNYLAVNNNHPPAEVSQLASHFDSPVEPALLERYAIGRSGEAGTGVPVNLSGGLEIWERREAMVDDEHEWRIFTRADGGWGHGAWSRTAEILRSAGDAYRAAHGGSRPSDPHQLIPFLPDPNEAAVLREIEQRANVKRP